MIHGFITSGGQKMSKSLGNVIDPIKIVDEYGTDALRYFLARHVHPFEDSDFTMERFHEAYTANLVNGLGNLVSRVMKLAEMHLLEPVARPEPAGFSKEYTDAIEHYEFNVAMDYIWKRVGEADLKMSEEQPFKLVKGSDEERARGIELIQELALELYHIGRMLNPFMPATNALIKETVLANKKPETMFPRVVV
jgi:methionyl-tRNA synthetase